MKMNQIICFRIYALVERLLLKSRPHWFPWTARRVIFHFRALPLSLYVQTTMRTTATKLHLLIIVKEEWRHSIFSLDSNTIHLILYYIYNCATTMHLFYQNFRAKKGTWLSFIQRAAHCAENMIFGRLAMKGRRTRSIESSKVDI